jgi:hypothetical protein
MHVRLMPELTGTLHATTDIRIIRVTGAGNIGRPGREMKDT